MSFVPGSDILIKRSNGMVQSATILEVKGSTIQVEWIEAGETKGKEVSLIDAIELNRQKENQLSSTQAATQLVSKQASDRRSQLPQARRLPRMTTRPVTQAADFPEQTQVQSHIVAPIIPSSQKNADTTSQLRRPKAAAPIKEPLCVRKTEAPKVQQEAPLQPKMARLTTFNQGLKSTPETKFVHMIEDYRQQMKAMPPPPPPPTDQRITVAVRKRPMNRKEQSKQEIDIVTIPARDHLILHEPKMKVDLTPVLENSVFRFDYAFDEGADNEFVYRYTAKPLVKSIFEGGMATCFAYGQTGSGKTHTMGGSFTTEGKANQQVDKGIYYYVTRDVFALHRSPQFIKENLIVSASFYEIYSGKVFDLLNGKKLLRVLEYKQQVQIVGLSETQVHSVQNVLQLIQQGSACRTSGSTTANSNSSRSHAIFQISLYKQAGREMILHGRFSLVDLAGNERAADTGKTNDAVGRREAADINQSLLALKECIRALVRKGSHCPFRRSRLTHILKDSFVGEKSRTCMIAMISPGKTSCDYTLNTLRYADRVKELVAGDLQQLNSDEGMDEISDNDLNIEKENFVQAVQDSEEQVLEEHQDLIADTDKILKSLQRIRCLADDPSYDVYEYIEQLNVTLTDFTAINERVARLPGQIEELKVALANEERAAGRD